MKVGSKVVCLINFIPRAFDPVKVTMPVKDEIYTVREILSSRGEVGIRLEEIVNPPATYVWGGRPVTAECGFLAIHFREVDNSFGEEVCSKIEEEVLELQEV